MSTTTTNFGWTIPSDTDLVKDGAAAIRTLGQGIDTSMADLEGGTTGQILSKASGTDMDFTWIDNQVGDITGVTAGTGISGGGTSGTVTVTNSMATAIDAKGDLIAGTGADAFARLAVGTNGQVLVADSAESTGLKWGTAASGALTKISSGTFSSSSAVNINNIFSSSYSHYKFLFNLTSTSAQANLNVRMRVSGADNTTSNYYNNMRYQRADGAAGLIGSTGADFWYIATPSTGGYFMETTISFPYENQKTLLTMLSQDVDAYGEMGGALFNATTSFDGITFYQASGTITGQWVVYGYEKG